MQFEDKTGPKAEPVHASVTIDVQITDPERFAQAAYANALTTSRMSPFEASDWIRPGGKLSLESCLRQFLDPGQQGVRIPGVEIIDSGAKVDDEPQWWAEAEAMLRAKDDHDLHKIGLAAAQSAGYMKHLEVSFMYWHFGRHAEFAREKGLDGLAKVFAVGWQAGHRVLRAPDAATAEAERQKIRSEYGLPVPSPVVQQRQKIADMEAMLRSVAEGLAVIEQGLAKAEKAEPGDAPFPLVGDQARLWHNATAAAYQHALEMCGSQTLREFLAAADVEPQEAVRPRAERGG